MTVTQCVDYAVPEDVYHADMIFGKSAPPMLSNSVAKVLLGQSPAHAREAHPKLRTMKPVETDNDAFDLGKTVHALLHGGMDGIEVVEADSWRTKAAKAERKRIRAEGKTPILIANMERVQAMYDAIQKQLPLFRDVPGFYGTGFHEVTIVWQEPNGVWCKARLDWLYNAKDPIIIGDLKSTSVGARSDAFDRQIAQNDYDMQAAFYRRGARKVFGADNVRFIFMAVETTPPYAVSLTEMGYQGQTYADEKVAHAIDLWGKCLAAKEWPAYSTRVHKYEPTTWVMERWEDRLRADRENRGLLEAAYDFQKPLMKG